MFDWILELLGIETANKEAINHLPTQNNITYRNNNEKLDNYSVKENKANYGTNKKDDDKNVRYSLDFNYTFPTLTLENKKENKTKVSNTTTDENSSKIKLKKNDNIEILDEYKLVEKNLTKLFEPNITFVSGGAGTGKSYLVKYLTKILPKDTFVLLAPTGAAAINIEGQTIHSFCKFPLHVIDFSSLLENDPNKYERNKFICEKIQNIKTIVIDEISMVRCDLLDGVDKYFRYYSRINYPFGGKKVLFIGDLLQLPPVVKKEDKKALKDLGYKSPFYCFNSKVWQEYKPYLIPLTNNKRQASLEFYNQLQQIRIGNKKVLSYFNINCNSLNQNNYIFPFLTTTKDLSSQINEKCLNKLNTQNFDFKGIITGKFSENDVPVPKTLSLKCGCKVMTVINDTQKRFVNGSIGEITKIHEPDIFFANGSVTIRLDHSKEEIQIGYEKWEAYEYEYDTKAKKLLHKVVGTYSQIPLIPAWAITIHKAQGLTITQFTIGLGSNAAFADGQTYVALSRCPTIGNITLTRPLKDEDIKISYPALKEYENLTQ